MRRCETPNISHLKEIQLWMSTLWEPQEEQTTFRLKEVEHFPRAFWLKTRESTQTLPRSTLSKSTSRFPSLTRTHLWRSKTVSYWRGMTSVSSSTIHTRWLFQLKVKWTFKTRLPTWWCHNWVRLDSGRQRPRYASEMCSPQPLAREGMPTICRERGQEDSHRLGIWTLHASQVSSRWPMET